ncbi:MAG: hypothetical protein CMN55_00135 [Sneathiella sp.]|jgi:hypothetical protein|uniref:hypothetical protein n=1 Tax=Sneathiella sp. TaxID=1964365 RepID=UPI000C60A6A6|nr:hypothetical protein [Sneathiella sp.]MAL77522.1 hypothetical protein [Sneathiella sp.]|tara:strand:+ start:4988 stop:7777 length:2790 start_codon:yes stop_codon:yes gene_type:complete
MITPKQQKAQFSAFDTTSRFRSGLRDVGQALTSLGQSAQSYSASVKQKEREAQNQGARKADAERQVQYNGKLDELNIAVENGAGREVIEKLQNEALAIRDTPLSSFLPKDSPITLDDESAMAPYNDRFYKATGNIAEQFKANNAQAEIVKSAEEAGDNYKNDVTTALVDYFGVGTPMSVFDGFLTHKFFTEEGQDIYSISKGLTKEGRESYLAATGKGVVAAVELDLGNTTNIDDLTEKRDKTREFMKNNPELGFDFADIEKLENAYDTRYAALSEPSNLKKNKIADVQRAITQIETAFGSNKIQQTEARQQLIELLKIQEDALPILTSTDSNMKRLDATIGVVRLLLPEMPEGMSLSEVFENEEYNAKIGNEPSVYQDLLKDITIGADSPEDANVKVVLGDRLNTLGYNLDSSAVSKISDKLASERTAIQAKLASGDASFFVSFDPTRARIYKVAQTNDGTPESINKQRAARSALYLDYNAFAKPFKDSGGTVMGYALPNTFFVPQQTNVEAGAANMAAYRKQDIALNGIENTNAHYGIKASNTKGMSAEEVIYAAATWGYTSQMLRSQVDGEVLNPEAAFDSVLSLYDSHEKVSNVAKAQVDEIIQEHGSAMAAYIDNLKFQAPEAAQAFTNLLYGAIYTASVAGNDPLDVNDKEAVRAELNRVEAKKILPLFGLTSENDSGSYTSIPPQLLKDVDFRREALMRGEGFWATLDEPAFPIARIFNPLFRLFRDQATSDIVGDYYKNAVAAALVQKFDLDLIRRATGDLMPVSFSTTIPNIPNVYSPTTTGVGTYMGETTPSAGRRNPAEQKTREDRRFVEALMRGIDGNQTPINEDSSQGTFRISLPVWERNVDGTSEQRVYLEMFDTVDGKYTRVADGSNELYVLFDDVKNIYDAAFEKEVTLGGNDGTFADKNIRREVVKDVAFSL